MPKPTAPRDLSVYRFVVSGEEIVLFEWSAEQASVPLAPAEQEVLALLLEGRTNRAIAEARSTSVRTVANQVAALLRKLGAGSRFELLGRLGSPHASTGDAAALERRKRPQRRVRRR